MCL
ncbi:hypothetical protein S40285_10888, partial [Stachybotrys chlorohalonatus IBT 40285]|jgi:chromosome segregation ATPase